MMWADERTGEGKAQAGKEEGGEGVGMAVPSGKEAGFNP